MKRLLALSCLLLSSTAAFADATLPTRDLDGARDPAWLQRYEGSFIVSAEHRAFDEMRFPAGKLERDPGEGYDAYNNMVHIPKAVRAVEGEYDRLVYVAPAERSPVEVLRNYLDMVAAAGGSVVYRCADTDCGGSIEGNDHGGGTQGVMEHLYPQNRLKDADFSNGKCATGGTPSEQQYALTTLPDGAGGTRTLAVYAFAMQARTYCDALADRTGVLVVAVSPRAMESRMVTVSADDMAKALDADGHIALYGILFDTNKSSLKPESMATIEQIAALLKAQPALNLDVVGHTDNVGDAAGNLRLSQRRADAVVTALVEDHGIDEARLAARGEGLTAPLADNGSEEGRAKNRRVELVKR